MLKILVRKQLQEVFHRFLRREGRKGKKRSGKAMAITLILLTLYLIAIFAWVAWMLSEQLFEAEMGWLFYLLQGGAAVLFGVFGSVFSTYSTLYLAKDNDLLLSMPIPVRDVIASRLLSVYVMGLAYSAVLSLPSAVVGLIRGGFSFSGLVGALIFILLISLIVLALSCLLGWVVAKLSLRLKNKSWMTVLISLTFLALYYVVYFRVMQHLPELIEAMIRVGGKIKTSAWPIYLFGRIGEGDWLGMLVWTAGVLLLLALVWFVMKRSFLAIATSTVGRKTVRGRQEARQSSVSAALLRREWLRFTSSSTYMLNCGLGLVLLLGLGFWLLIQGREIMTFMSAFLSGFPGVMPVLGCAVCSMLAGMVDITAPSVSLEGRTLWQIQSLPVTPWQVLRAKLELHLGLAAVPVLFSAVCVLVVLPNVTLAQKLLILTVTVLTALFFALIGLFFGIKLPNLDWTNEIVPIKQGMPVLFTILSGLGLGLILGGLYFLFGHRLGATGWLGVFSLLLAAADAVLFLWLRGSGADRFAELN